MDGISALIRDPRKRAPSSLLPCDVTVRKQPTERELTLTRICIHRDLGLPILQNCEKYIFVLYKHLVYGIFCHGSLNELKQSGNAVRHHPERSGILNHMRNALIEEMSKF